MLTRRSILKNAARALAAPMINRGRFSLFAQTDTEYSARTVDLVRRSTVIDMLGLLTLDYQKLCSLGSRRPPFPAIRFSPPARLRYHRIFTPPWATPREIFTPPRYRDITGWNAFLTAHQSQFLRMESAADFERAKERGAIGIVIGQQNSEHFRTVADVDRFYALGQRVSQLTYRNNRIGAGSSDPQSRSQRIRSGCGQPHEPGRHGRGYFALRRPDFSGRDRSVPHAGAGYAFQLSYPGARQPPLQDG